MAAALGFPLLPAAPRAGGRAPGSPWFLRVHVSDNEGQASWGVRICAHVSRSCFHKPRPPPQQSGKQAPGSGVEVGWATEELCQDFDWGAGTLAPRTLEAEQSQWSGEVRILEQGGLGEAGTLWAGAWL